MIMANEEPNFNLLFSSNSLSSFSSSASFFSAVKKETELENDLKQEIKVEKMQEELNEEKSEKELNEEKSEKENLRYDVDEHCISISKEEYLNGFREFFLSNKKHLHNITSKICEYFNIKNDNMNKISLNKSCMYNNTNNYNNTKENEMNHEAAGKNDLSYISLLSYLAEEKDESASDNNDNQIFLDFNFFPTFSLEIDLIELSDFNNFLSFFVLNSSQIVIPLLNNFIMPSIFISFSSFIFTNLYFYYFSFQPSQKFMLNLSLFLNAKMPLFQVRFSHFPRDISLFKSSVKQISNSKIGSFICLEAVVVSIGGIKMLEAVRTYRCAECGFVFKAYSSPEIFYFIDLPMSCPSGLSTEQIKLKKYDKKKKLFYTKKCKSKNFVEIKNECIRTDYQEVRVKDCVNSANKSIYSSKNMNSTLVSSSTNAYISVVLKGDLVNSCKIGDEVLFVGSVFRRFTKFIPTCFCEVELFIEANNVIVHQDEFNHENNDLKDSKSKNIVLEFCKEGKNKRDNFYIKNFIIDSFCKNLHAMRNAKLATLLSLIGGVECADEKRIQELCKSRWDVYENKQNKIKYAYPGMLYEEELDNETKNYMKANNQDNSLNVNEYSNCNDFDKSRNNSHNFESNNQNKSSNTNNCKYRKDIHILLLGDAGMGKSQLLRAACEVSNKAIQTTGVNSTPAGMTCAVIRENNEFVLEGGAFILADKGILCIDEFSCIKNDCLLHLHEAMQQQTISIAKAGIVCKLNTRCSVIAASNYKIKKSNKKEAHYEKYLNDSIYNSVINKDKNSNTYIHYVERCYTNIPISLLSRFDIIIVLYDNTQNDVVKANFIVNQVVEESKKEEKEKEEESIDIALDTSSCSSLSSLCCSAPFPSLLKGKRRKKRNLWTEKELKEYINYIKVNYNPKISANAEKILSVYYRELRKNENNCISLRFFESLIRVAQAHARLLMHKCVTLFDAVNVIWMIEAGLAGNKVCASLKKDEKYEEIGREGLISLFKTNNNVFSSNCMKSEIRRNEKKAVYSNSFANNNVKACDVSYNNYNNSKVCSGVGKSNEERQKLKFMKNQNNDVCNCKADKNEHYCEGEGRENYTRSKKDFYVNAFKELIADPLNFSISNKYIYELCEEKLLQILNMRKKKIFKSREAEFDFCRNDSNYYSGDDDFCSNHSVNREFYGSSIVDTEESDAQKREAFKNNKFMSKAMFQDDEEFELIRISEDDQRNEEVKEENAFHKKRKNKLLCSGTDSTGIPHKQRTSPYNNINIEHKHTESHVDFPALSFNKKRKFTQVFQFKKF